MSSVVISGNTSGTITLDAPAVAGTTTLTLPATSGTVALTASPTFTGQATIPTINLTGGQITFPATAVPSADANTLDDYEEGTWTPTLANLTVGNGIVTGTYTKVGDVVTIMAQVDWRSTTSCTTVTGLGGLPFAVKSGTNFPSAYLSCSWLRQGVGWYTGSAVCVQGQASFNQLSVSGGGSVLSNTNPVTWLNTDAWTFSSTYKT
jgi:hypothetical protein